MHRANEAWRTTLGYPGYEVSDLGNVRSFRSANGRGPLTNVPRPVRSKPAPGKKYVRAALSDGIGNTKQVPIHLLVLEAFIGPRPSAMHDGCHGDGDATNNVLSNLRWGTKQDNADDRSTHGTQSRGEGIAKAVLTTSQVLEIKAAIPVWKKGMGRQFAQRFGVSDSVVSSIKHGQTWSHI